MARRQALVQEIGTWAVSAEAQQPILLISSSPKGIEEMVRFAQQAAACTHQTGTPCGTCKACKQVAAGTYSDTLTIEGENGRIKIKDIEYLREMLRSTSDKRMICIPHADQILPEAANALLKTLEEPSKSARFLLCAPSKRSVLPTIYSRCNILFSAEESQLQEQPDAQRLLEKLSQLRKSEPFADEQLQEISQLIHTLLIQQGASVALFKASQRLRDYYKTASFAGGNTKLAADILLASLANLRNTVR